MGRCVTINVVIDHAGSPNVFPSAEGVSVSGNPLVADGNTDDFAVRAEARISPAPQNHRCHPRLTDTLGFFQKRQADGV